MVKPASLETYSPDPEFAVIPLGLVASGARRLEGESYLTGGYAIRRRIEALPAGWVKLETLAKIWQPSRLTGISTSREHGVPFLTATQVFDIRPLARKWLVKSRTKDYAERLVQPGWILLTCSGTVGDAMISYEPHVGHIVSHDLLRLQPRNEALRGYIYTFLRTRYGRSMLESSKYGSIIKHLEPEHVQGIPILQDEAAIYRAYGRAVDEVFRLRGEAFTLGKKAEDMFFQAVGGRRAALASEEGFEVRATKLFFGSRRVDAYNHNPTADAAETVLASSGRELQSLGDVASIYGVARFKHLYTAAGIAYLDSEDLIKVNPGVHKYIPETTKMRDPKRYYVKAGWLLMVCSGQLYGINGSVIQATPWHEGKMVSNHVLRIITDERKSRPGYLQVALGHPEIGRPLVLRCAFGTEVPEIGAVELSAFPLVRLEEAREAAIADLTERATLLRMKADKKENGAVARLEERISEKLGGAAGDATPEAMFARLQEVTRGLLRVPKAELDKKVAEARASARERRKAKPK